MIVSTTCKPYNYETSNNTDISAILNYCSSYKSISYYQSTNVSILGTDNSADYFFHL